MTRLTFSAITSIACSNPPFLDKGLQPAGFFKVCTDEFASPSVSLPPLHKDVKLTFFLVPVSSTVGIKAHLKEEEDLCGIAPCDKKSSNCEPVSIRENLYQSIPWLHACPRLRAHTQFINDFNSQDLIQMPVEAKSTSTQIMKNA